ncbi:MAG: nitrogen regulation protein NR(II), partial [Actinomycetota bacterium]
MQASSSRRLGAGLVATVWVGAGLVAIVAYFVAPASGPVRAGIFAALCLGTAVSVLTGLRVHRPERPTGWVVLACGYVFYVIADVMWYQGLPFPSPADSFFLLSYSLLVVGVALIAGARSRGLDRGGSLDAMVVATGVGVFSWTFLMSPYINDTGLSLTAQLVSLAYPFFDMLLLGVLVRLSFASTARHASYRLLSLGVVCQLVADTGYSIALLNNEFHFSHPALAGYMLSFTLVGAAALHPSMRSLTLPMTDKEATSRNWRLALLGASALVPSAVLISEASQGRLDNVPAIAAISAALFLLVLVRVGGLMSDLNERKVMEKRLREAESKYRDLVEQLPGVVYTAEPGPDGRWVYVSPQIDKLLGFSPEEWMADPELWLQRVHPADRDRVTTGEAAAVEEITGRTNDEYRLVARDGRAVWVRDEATLVRDERGRPSFFRGMLFDITERKSLEDQLRQSQKMEAVGQLAGGVAHDFNNLLAVVQNYARFAAEGLREGDPRLDDLQEIMRAGERGAQLTRQLLTFSRREVVQPQVLDLNEIVSEMHRMLTRTIPVSVRLTTSLAPDLWRVKIDRGQIEQILMNLVVNARDAVGGGGRITIETSNVDASREAAGDMAVDPGAYVCLSV